MGILGAKNLDFWGVLKAFLWLCYAVWLPGAKTDQGQDVRRVSRVTLRRVLVKFVTRRQISTRHTVPLLLRHPFAHCLH